MIRSIILTIATTLGLYSLSSCRKTTVDHRNSAIITTVSSTGASDEACGSSTGALCLSMQIVDDIGAELLAAGLQEKQVAAIKQGALALIVDSSTGLRLAGVSTKLEELVPLIIKGAIAAMSSTDAELTDDSSKLAVAETITGSLFKSLSTKMESITSEARTKLPASIAKEAIGSLDEGGLSGEALNRGIGKVVSKSVSNIKSIGVSKDELNAAVTEVASSGMQGMTDAGITTDTLGAAMETFLSETVSALVEAGADGAEEINTISKSVARASIAKLGSMGVKDANVMKQATKSITSGTMKGMGQLKSKGNITHADVQTATKDIAKEAVDTLYEESKTMGITFNSDLTSGISEGMVEGLARSGYNTTELGEVTDDVKSGFEVSIGEKTDLTENAATYSAAVEASTTTWINEVESHCRGDGGEWDSATGICNYPVEDVNETIETQPDIIWESITGTFNSDDRTLNIQRKMRLNGNELTSCTAIIDENRSPEWDASVTLGDDGYPTEESISHTFTITRTSAHTLYGRFTCWDGYSRFHDSGFSAAIAIPEVTVSSSGSSNTIDLLIVTERSYYQSKSIIRFVQTSTIDYPDSSPFNLQINDDIYEASILSGYAGSSLFDADNLFYMTEAVRIQDYLTYGVNVLAVSLPDLATPNQSAVTFTLKDFTLFAVAGSYGSDINAEFFVNNSWISGHAAAADGSLISSGFLHMITH